MSESATASAPAKTQPKAKKNRLSSGFFRFVLTRFLLIIPTVFILVTIVFFVMRATGDPISAAMGGRLTPEELQRRIHAAGYDRPLVVQYLDYLGGLLRGDLGTTLTDNQPVTTILTRYGAATFELAFLSLIVALIVGIGLGRLAARRRDHAADAGIRVFAILCYATPVFFLGLMLKLVFAVWLNVLPPSGRSSFASDMQFQRLVSPTGFYIIDAFQLGDMSVLVDVLRHAVLPALALGLLTAGVFIRLVRTNVISTYTSGYVEAARSRGVSEGRLLSKHAWRPAMIPIITVMGMQIALMLAGAVLTETTFEWKGLGFMLSQYLKQRDFVAVQGIVILIAIIVAVLLSIFAGVLLGLISGYFGGWVDRVLVVIADAIYSFPSLLLAILMAIMISGGQSGLWSGILASGISITVVYIPQYFRTIRAEVVRIKGSAYVESAKVVGASTWRIMTKHLLKNSTRTLPVILTLNSSEAILTLAGLGFLGFGIEPTSAAEWGYDLNRSVADVTAGIWWTAVFPGIAIVLIVLGITLVGESLNDLADPRLRARKSAGEVIGSIEDTTVDPSEKPSADNEVIAELKSEGKPQVSVENPAIAQVMEKEIDHE